MKQIYTTQLFWRKYAYRIQLQGYVDKATISNHLISTRKFRNWLKDHNIVKYKLACDIDWQEFYAGRSANAILRVYLENDNDFEKVLEAYNPFVVDTCAPYKKSHIDILKNNGSIKIRAKLLFNKYRYTVVFKYWLNEETAEGLENFVKNSLDSENAARVKFVAGQWKDQNTGNWVRLYSTTRLYLRDEEDLIMTKLAWSDEILRIEAVMLHSELDDNAVE